MSIMSDRDLDMREDPDWEEGPNQEPSGFEIVAVAVPVLLEVICVCLGFACAILWCGIGSGRI